MSEYLDSIADSLKEQGKQARARARQDDERERLLEEFRALDRKSIKKKTDTELAIWQSQYPKESPQFIFAEQLWKYRLARKSATFAALIALVALLVGYMLRAAEDPSNAKTKPAVQQNEGPPVANKASNIVNNISHIKTP